MLKRCLPCQLVRGASVPIPRVEKGLPSMHTRLRTQLRNMIRVLSYQCRRSSSVDELCIWRVPSEVEGSWICPVVRTLVGSRGVILGPELKIAGISAKAALNIDYRLLLRSNLDTSHTPSISTLFFFVILTFLRSCVPYFVQFCSYVLIVR